MSNNANTTPPEDGRAPGPGCQHTGDRGKRCGVPAEMVRPTGWCWFHDPELADQRRLAQRLGNQTQLAKRARARKRGLLAEELGPLVTIVDAQRHLQLISAAVGEGVLSASAGNTMLSATRAWLAAEDTRLRSEVLPELQRQIAELRSRKAKILT